MTRAEKYLARIAELGTVGACRRAADYAATDERLTADERSRIEAAAFARACECILAEGARRRSHARATTPPPGVERPAVARAAALAHR